MLDYIFCNFSIISTIKAEYSKMSVNKCDSLTPLLVWYKLRIMNNNVNSKEYNDTIYQLVHKRRTVCI